VVTETLLTEVLKLLVKLTSYWHICCLPKEEVHAPNTSVLLLTHLPLMPLRFVKYIKTLL